MKSKFYFLSRVSLPIAALVVFRRPPAQIPLIDLEKRLIIGGGEWRAGQSAQPAWTPSGAPGGQHSRDEASHSFLTSPCNLWRDRL